MNILEPAAAPPLQPLPRRAPPRLTVLEDTAVGDRRTRVTWRRDDLEYCVTFYLRDPDDGGWLWQREMDYRTPAGEDARTHAFWLRERWGFEDDPAPAAPAPLCWGRAFIEARRP